jgi:hypothetical protein
MILKDVSEPLLWWWYTFIVRLQSSRDWLTLGFPALSLRSLTAEVRLEYPSTNHRGALACRSFYAVF